MRPNHGIVKVFENCEMRGDKYDDKFAEEIMHNICSVELLQPKLF